ncbi:hypothetical protein ACNH6C_13850 [Bdellovibrio bacteriovorus]|uniref:hypothetical protein n=1 Tax=Bdellovibrio bacteriovorus TaxID=959 RepID=UPI003A809DD1
MYPANPFTLNYEKRIVAFLDVMGFQNLLANNEDSKRRLEKYYAEAMKYLNSKTNAYSANAPQDDFKKMFVSDSIILSVRISGDNDEDLLRMGRFISTVGQLQAHLASKACIWTRGAISIGNLHIDEYLHVLVGQAFVNAYELEKIADYPRVIIDPTALRHFNHHTNAFISFMDKLDYRSYLLGPNQPSKNGLPPFSNEAIQVDWFRHLYSEHDPLEEYFRDLIERQHSNQSLFTKTQKLIRYFVESHLHHSERRYFQIREDLVFGARYNYIVNHLSQITTFINKHDVI